MLLLVAYDLHEPGRVYEPVQQAIKNAGAWAHVEESVWIVDTLLTPENMLERLRAAADANDSLFVVRIHQNWWSVNLSSSVVDWLKDPGRRW